MKKSTLTLKTSAMLLCLVALSGMSALGLAIAWEPPAEVSREDCIKAHKDFVAMPDLKLKEYEDIFRIQAVGMDWDVGVMVYEPQDRSKIPTGPDGKKIGVFLLHGGSGDYRDKEELARILAGKFGYRVTSMTYPGRLYLPDPSRNWPGDTIHTDGSVRTPIWKKGEVITRDQYEVIEDTSKRERYGTLIMAKAKPDTTFYYRMAGWPVAFEEAMKEVCRRYLPVGEYSIYAHGHSTGGPYVHYLLQRVQNIVGVIGVENSPFGYIFSKLIGQTWNKWDSLRIRSWRDTARYEGFELLEKEGPDALKHLPRVMEDVFAKWRKETHEPQFKVEDLIQFNGVKALEEAAQVTAKHMNLGPKETDALVARYVGYTRELSGPGVKPVPPLLLGITIASRDHNIKKYKEILLPMFAEMKPAPKVRVVQFQAGVHSYTAPEKDLPLGIAPAVVKMWHEAILQGYYIQ